MTTLSEDSPAMVLPDTDEYMTMCFRLSGIHFTGSTSLSGSTPAVPLTWTEVDSFCNRSGYQLTGWESEQIINMSRSYCYTLSKSSDINYPAPYQEGFDSEDSIEQMRKRVADQWDSFN